jgi:hypothetical protein
MVIPTDDDRFKIIIIPCDAFHTTVDNIIDGVHHILKNCEEVTS